MLTRIDQRGSKIPKEIVVVKYTSVLTRPPRRKQRRENAMVLAVTEGRRTSAWRPSTCSTANLKTLPHTISLLQGAIQ